MGLPAGQLRVTIPHTTEGIAMKHVLAIAAVLALGSGPANAKSARCTDATTHRFVKCPATSGAPVPIPIPTPPANSAPMMSRAPTASASTGGAPHCTKGKVCGHSCIALDKVCHKPS